MALPTPTDLKTLDYSYLGQPFCHVAAKAAITLAGMDYSYLGQPFVANEGGSTPPASLNMLLNIGDVWKAISSMQINVGDTWKAVTGMKVNVGDTWKTIF